MRPPTSPPLARRQAPLSALLAAGALAALAGCASPPQDRAPEPPEQRVDSRGERIDLASSPLLDEIAVLEDQRTTGNGRLVELLADPDDQVRARAAVALGRMPFPEVGAEATDALARALEDPVPEVRLAAIFALGERADPESAGVLAAYRNDPDPRVRARVVQAASKIDDPALHDELLVALRDTDLGVRIEAALATARWDPTRGDGEVVDRALLDALRPYVVTPRRPRSREVETELAWRILYALARRHSQLGCGAFLEYAASAMPLERLFAVRGLTWVPTDDEVLGALEQGLKDAHALAKPDWRVCYEAAEALAHHADPRSLEALLAATENEQPHVRAGVFEALGHFPGAEKRVLPVLRRGLLDVSTSVRVAALGSMAAQLAPADAQETLERYEHEEDPVLRAGVAEAAATVKGDPATALLIRLTKDPDERVATTAVEGLGGRITPDVRKLLHGLLASSDNGLRLGAVLALREAPDASDVAPLVAAFSSSTGDASSEIAYETLRDLAAIGGPEAERTLQGALDDPRAYVRHVAARELHQRFGSDVSPATLPPRPVLDDPPPPVAGKDFPRWRYDPMVEVTTTRGTMVFELFPAEAPVHVFNFLSLAKAGAYDDLAFHRVVPDFVIQGGDYRGDGNGSRPWRGTALRQEIGPRPFVRGSLGMPRNDDLDSGGSQFFVTQRPTPHLDGRYTIFGELRSGDDVLDRIEVGDRILSVRLLK